MRTGPLVLFGLAFVLSVGKAGAQTAPPAPATDAEIPSAAAPRGDVAGSDAEAALPREVLPPEYPPPAARTRLAIAGGAVFAVWYAGSLGASFVWSDYPGAKELRIPVVGPWLSLRHAGCEDDECSTSTVILRVVASILDGVGQVGGLAAIGEAVFLPTASEETGPKPPRAFVRPTPFVGGTDAIGLGVRGAF